jgi:hypothetical protein
VEQEPKGKILILYVETLGWAAAAMRQAERPKDELVRERIIEELTI